MGIFGHMSAGSPLKVESSEEDDASKPLRPGETVEKTEASIEELAKKLDSTFPDKKDHFTIDASTTRVDYNDHKKK